VDTSIIALKVADAALQTQISKLKEQVKKLDEEARKFAKISVPTARHTLQRKLTIEKCIQNRIQAHDNICSMLMAIQTSQINAEVISAVKETSSALKEQNKKYSVDDVEELLDDVRDIISETNDISDVVAKGVEPDKEEEDEKILQELAMLQLEDELEKKEKLSAVVPPNSTAAKTPLLSTTTSSATRVKQPAFSS